MPPRTPPDRDPIPGPEAEPQPERLDPASVCTLPPEARAERLAWIRREILPHAVARERLADGVAFEWTAEPGLAAALDRLVALERACCGAIAFERVAGAAPGRLRLEIRGIDPDAAILDAGV